VEPHEDIVLLLVIHLHTLSRVGEEDGYFFLWLDWFYNDVLMEELLSFDLVWRLKLNEVR